MRNQPIGAMPPMRPVTNQASAGGALPMGAPELNSSDTPSRMPFMASVTMIGESPKSTMVMPLRKPMAIPIPSAAGITHAAGASTPLQRVVTTIAGKVMVHGTERSSPPVMMTVPWPRPRIAKKAVRISMALR